ncbi:hypothetical protein L207DRAFT_538148 [Hyaloscypha variabilis F]|uniref:Uncharacterized protein n=1 Tax=Hyaloscypha variabilis (strain UAMH 11265 / GT02V1 / F) TaxID=1149755 RepID=A0A2J6QVG6_HYAVF|nr:hypothetical protein L207DRAFT_538148 [Hyaloscypha variabilis F]
MPFRTNLLLFFVLSSANAQIKDGCPKDQVACLDIINSSQCIEQVIIEHQQNVTRENLINCIDIPGVSSSNLPGATKFQDMIDDNGREKKWIGRGDIKIKRCIDGI